MRALLQRVRRAAVRVTARGRGASSPGLLVFLGVGHGDDEATADALARRICELRIFEDDGRADEPLAARRRRRVPRRQPVHALRGHPPRPPARVHRRRAPEPAERCGCRVADGIEARASTVGLGEFGAEMAVELVNDGPFTIWLDTADAGPDRRRKQ